MLARQRNLHLVAPPLNLAAQTRPEGFHIFRGLDVEGGPDPTYDVVDRLRYQLPEKDFRRAPYIQRF